MKTRRSAFKGTHFVLLLLIGTIFYCSATGQKEISRLSGQVTDRISGQGIPGAAMKLTGKKDTLIILSDKRGDFRVSKLPFGQWRIVINALSFHTLDTTVEVSSINQLNFSLSRNQQELDSVLVSSNQVRNTVNKLTYNVSASDRKQHASALDLLSTVPLINTSGEGTVFIKGHSNIQILIDGKPILGNSVLNSISPNIISKIEIQSNPQAAYSGSGLFAVVNIITVKDWKGYYGRMSATIGTNSNLHTSSYLSFKSKKTETNFDAGLHYYSRPWSNLIQTTYPGKDTGINLHQQFINNGFSPYAALGFKYQINKKSSLNYALNISLAEFNNSGNSDYVNVAGGFNTKLLQSTGQEKEAHWWNIKNYLDYTVRPDNKTSFITALQYYAQPSMQSTNNIIDNLSYQSKNRIINNPLLKELSAQVVLQKNLSAATSYQAGLKWINRVNQSDYELDTFHISTGLYSKVNDSAYTNNFYATQNIYSAFGNFTFKLSKTLSGDVGIRVEETSDKINFGSSAQVNRKYFQLIPNTSLSFEINNSSNLSFNLNKNISRPAIYFLNPISNIVNSKNIDVGNPQLNPEKAFGVNVAYNTSVKTNNFSFTLYYQDNSGLISSGLEKGSGDTIYSRYLNLGSVTSIGISSDVACNLSKALRLSLHLAVENNTILYGSQKMTGVQFYSNANLLWRLPGKVSMRLLHQFNSRVINFQGKEYALSSDEIVLSKRIWKDKWIISFGDSDFLGINSKRVGDLKTETFTQKTNADLHLSYYYLKLSFTFGKTQFASNPNIRLTNTDLKNTR